MVAPKKARVIEAQQRVTDVMAGRWLREGTPYSDLVQAERTASHMTHAGCIPGVLIDIDYAVAGRQLSGRRRELLAARQELAAARVAAGELQAEVILSSDMLAPIAAFSADRLGAQLRTLAAAAADGWQLRLAPAADVSIQLPNIDSMILIGNPAQPDAAYFERPPGRHPHETWNTPYNAPEVIRRSGIIYEALSAVALDAAHTQEHLARQAAAIQ